MIRIVLFFSFLFSFILTPLAFAAENSASGTLLVANRTGGSVSLIDLQTRTEIARLPIGPFIPHEMAASPNGRWAATGEYGTGNNPGRHLVIIDVAAAEIVSRIDLGANSRPHSIVFLSDNRHVVVTLENFDQLALVDIIDEEVISLFPTGGREGHMVKLSKNESQAYVASRGSGTLSVIWLNEERPAKVIATGARAEGIAVSPNGEEIWVANQGERSISIIAAETLEVITTLSAPATNRIEFLPDGSAVTPGGSSLDNSIRYISFYDGDSYELVRRLELPGSSAAGTGIRLLAADGVLILGDSALNEVSLFDPATGTAPERLINNSDNVDGLAWSPLRVDVFRN